MSLTEFLLARIAEDEDEERRIQETSPGSVYNYVRRGASLGRAQVGIHSIADRVLVECEAKRQIVELHRSTRHHQLGRDDWTTNECEICLLDADEGGGPYALTFEPLPCPTLRLLALPYADHPDYDEAWRP